MLMQNQPILSFLKIIVFPLLFQEGKQAALAADFSITQFSYIGRLLMVHGRNRWVTATPFLQPHLIFRDF